MKKAIVTGGAGFIGGHLTSRLIKEGYGVAIIDNLSTGKQNNAHPKARLYKVNARSPKVAEIFKKEWPNVVFHLAAQGSMRVSARDPVFDAEENILASLNVIKHFCSVPKTRGVMRKIIFASSGAVYGEAEKVPIPETRVPHPVFPYGIAKLAVEHYLQFFYRAYRMPYVALRFGNVYGPNQNSEGEAGVVAIFLDKIAKGEEIAIFGDGEQTRDFIYVEDVVEAAVRAAKARAIGIYNTGTCKESSINQLVKAFEKTIKKEVRRTYKEAMSGEVRRSALDCRKIKKDLGWEAKVPLGKGIKRLVSHLANK